MKYEIILSKINKIVTRLIYRAPDTLRDAVGVLPISSGRLSVDRRVATVIAPYLPVGRQNRMTFSEVMEGFDCSVEVRYFHAIKLVENQDEWCNRFFQQLTPRLKFVSWIKWALRDFQEKKKEIVLWPIEPWYENYYHWLTCCLPKIIECERLVDGVLGVPVDVMSSRVKAESLKGAVHVFTETTIISGVWEGDLACVIRKGLPIIGIRSLRERFSLRNSTVNGRRIYITRTTAHYRFIENEIDLQTILKSRNFEFVEFDGLDFSDQARALCGASIIIGAHGAGLTNIIFAPQGSRLIEISPDFLNDPSYLSLCLICGINYTRLAARTVSPEAPQYSNLEVDISTLERVLDSSPVPDHSNASYFHVPADAARVEIGGVGASRPAWPRRARW